MGQSDGLGRKVRGPWRSRDWAWCTRVRRMRTRTAVGAGGWPKGLIPERILAFLKKKKLKDAFCIVGVTMIDLYPRDSWNFVFGQASLIDGVGIFSFARYGKDFYSSQYEGKVKKPQQTSSSDYSIFDNYYSPEITSILLWRSCKTLTHEIGHIFGLRHCQWLACLMQGSNHLEESDRPPLNLCPICLASCSALLASIL
ncbi:archaemetzincin-2 isoform X1 [Sigmodon hispidus]